jgi:hypothetical protein
MRSPPGAIQSYRQMVELFPWEKRLDFTRLINGLERLYQFRREEVLADFGDVLNDIRHLADDFEICLPATGPFFEGLWR